MADAWVAPRIQRSPASPGPALIGGYMGVVLVKPDESWNQFPKIWGDKPKRIHTYRHLGMTVYADGKLIHHQDRLQYSPGENWGLLCQILDIEFDYSEVKWEVWPWYEGTVYSGQAPVNKHPPDKLSEVYIFFAELEVKKIGYAINCGAEDLERQRRKYDEAVRHLESLREANDS